MGEGEDRNGKRRRNGEEDVILRLLEDDARARGDDSHIRWYPRRDERTQRNAFPGVYLTVPRYTPDDRPPSVFLD